MGICHIEKIQVEIEHMYGVRGVRSFIEDRENIFFSKNDAGNDFGFVSLKIWHPVV